MDEQQLAALFGPLALYSEHNKGDRIIFLSSQGQEVEDEIMWVCATAEGRPITYVMKEPDPQTGMPYLVYPGEVVESL